MFSKRNRKSAEHFYISMWVFIFKFTSGNGRKWFSALCKCGFLIAGWWWWSINVFASTVSLIIDVKYDSTSAAASVCLLVRFMMVRKSDFTEFVVRCAPQKWEFQVRKSEEPRQPRVCSSVQLPPQHRVTSVCSPVLSSVMCEVVPSLPAHVFGFSLTTYPVLRHHHQLLANNAAWQQCARLISSADFRAK